ncbi:MAG TPA: ABC-F family ATP-binding cassette domain-containing protein [Caulobacteraceae bacterium]|jgi:ATP-binding cassette subfamily F protein 3|nr:ABC-F family ATP-binding cassette domain-containing protein [Caulobacteraceae bacterium]
MLRFRDLTFDAYGRRFFDHADALIPDRAKVGLVGRNGAGKSTLFRLIKGELAAGGGDIEVPRGTRIGWVAQEHAASDVTLIDTVLEADERRAALMAALETAEPEALGDLYAELDAIDADRAPAKAAEILTGLGFRQADLARPMAEFSGGWRMRVAMAAALFAEPDLLLLDEPTNYLDLEGALWLEAKLKTYPASALVISHDRELLEGMDAILHLNEGRLDAYTGGFSDFERQRGERAQLQAATREKVETRRAHLQSFVDRFRATASKARQAQSRLKMIARLQTVAPISEESALPFLLPSPERALAPPLVRLEGVAVGYGGPPVLERLNLRLDPDDRIGLLGVNGSGKSTFARLIAHDLKPSHGHVSGHRRMRVGWFHQHQIEALDAEDTPLDIIRRALPDETEPQRRSRLAQFGFPAAKASTRVADLSGGERARLLLNLIAMKRPHLIILDEPTNHLDIDSRRALTEALNDYEGAVILITHDRSLMEMVADRLWFAGDGTVKPFDGDMDDYARHVLDRARAARRAPGRTEPAAPPPPPPAPPAAKISAASLAHKLSTAEAALERANAALAAADAELTDPKTWADPRRRIAAETRHAKAGAAVAEAEAKWLALAERQT